MSVSGSPWDGFLQMEEILLQQTGDFSPILPLPAGYSLLKLVDELDLFIN